MKGRSESPVVPATFARMTALSRTMARTDKPSSNSINRAASFISRNAHNPARMIAPTLTTIHNADRCTPQLCAAARLITTKIASEPHFGAVSQGVALLSLVESVLLAWRPFDAIDVDRFGDVLQLFAAEPSERIKAI
jgi:hypothetical protein